MWSVPAFDVDLPLQVVDALGLMLAAWVWYHIFLLALDASPASPSGHLTLETLLTLLGLEASPKWRWPYEALCRLFCKLRGQRRSCSAEDSFEREADLGGDDSDCSRRWPGLELPSEPIGTLEQVHQQPALTSGHPAFPSARALGPSLETDPSEPSAEADMDSLQSQVSGPCELPESLEPAFAEAPPGLELAEPDASREVSSEDAADLSTEGCTAHTGTDDADDMGNSAAAESSRRDESPSATEAWKPSLRATDHSSRSGYSFYKRERRRDSLTR
ncbi:unnamed protein product [Effrenium voratum]|nr:unnamed protein product [Effrenium voratum]